jgi:hypothetical protein
MTCVRARCCQLLLSTCSAHGGPQAQQRCDLRFRGWPGAGSNRRPSDFQTDPFAQVTGCFRSGVRHLVQHLPGTRRSTPFRSRRASLLAICVALGLVAMAGHGRVRVAAAVVIALLDLVAPIAR